MVIRWKKGLPPHRDEPWYLMTKLPPDQRWTARRLSDLYAKRMAVEQCFRDCKSKRNGWSLRDTGIVDPQRQDRLLLLAVAQTARQRYRPSAWSSNTRTDSLSDFVIGQLMIHTIGINDRVIHHLVNSLTRQTPNWGKVRRQSVLTIQKDFAKIYF